jgi:hypothetical protein
MAKCDICGTQMFHSQPFWNMGEDGSMKQFISCINGHANQADRRIVKNVRKR